MKQVITGLTALLLACTTVLGQVGDSLDLPVASEYRYKLMVDDEGNVSTDTVVVAYREYDARGRITLDREYQSGKKGRTWYYNYDKDGALKSKSYADEDGAKQEVKFTIDDRGLMVEEIIADRRLEHVYNGAGHRVMTLYKSMDDSLVYAFDEYEYEAGQLMWKKSYQLKPAYRRTSRVNGGFTVKTFKKSKKYITASPFVYYKNEYSDDGRLSKVRWFGKITPDFAVHQLNYAGRREVKREYYTKQGILAATEKVVYTYHQ